MYASLIIAKLYVTELTQFKLCLDSYISNVQNIHNKELVKK